MPAALLSVVAVLTTVVLDQAQAEDEPDAAEQFLPEVDRAVTKALHWLATNRLPKSAVHVRNCSGS